MPAGDLSPLTFYSTVMLHTAFLPAHAHETSLMIQESVRRGLCLRKLATALRTIAKCRVRLPSAVDAVDARKKKLDLPFLPCTGKDHGCVLCMKLCREFPLVRATLN